MRIYLDYAATTPVDSRVVEIMASYWSDIFGNPSSLHYYGQMSRKALEETRGIIANALHSEIDEIYFTSGGTESNNLAVIGGARANKNKGKHIITTVIEHHSVLHAFHKLENEGFFVTYLPVDSSGILDPKELLKAITKETILVSVMQANNEIGTIQPIKELSYILQGNSILFHVDGVQYFPHFKVDVKDLCVDLYSISSHKIYGPKGIGGLYVRNGISLEPLFAGGEQEKGLRPGTENLSAIAGFGEAVRILLKEQDIETKRLVKLRDILISSILSLINGSYLNGDSVSRLPNNASISFAGLDGESLVISLDLEGIACSTGSACASRGVEFSHVLKGIGLTNEAVRSTLRFTLGRGTTLQEIEKVVKIVHQVVNKMQGLLNISRA